MQKLIKMSSCICWTETGIEKRPSWAGDRCPGSSEYDGGATKKPSGHLHWQ